MRLKTAFFIALLLAFATPTATKASDYCLLVASPEVCECSYRKIGKVTFDKHARDQSIEACKKELRANRKRSKSKPRN
jgi:hypothetical protein